MQYVVAQLATPFDVVVQQELLLDVEPRLAFGQPFVDQLGLYLLVVRLLLLLIELIFHVLHVEYRG